MKVYFFALKKLSPPLNVYSQLEEMLALRACGWSYTMLSDRYSVPKTTIRYLARKFGLAEDTVKVTVIRKHTTSLHPSHAYDDGEITNPGKTYAEYVREDQERRKRMAATSSSSIGTVLGLVG